MRSPVKFETQTCFGRRRLALACRGGLLVVAVLLGVTLAMACRFNVRDVGFVDLGAESYRYYCFVDSQTPGEQVEAIRQVAGAAFLEANVAAQVVDLESPEDPDALVHYREAGSPKAPAAVLVSPDGKRSLAMSLVDPGVILQESLWSNMEDVYESPARDVAIANAIQSYGVIVIVEGEDAAENARVRGIADATVKRIGTALGKLEKVIRKAPVVHVIPVADAMRERVFLWSLGVDPGSRGQASVAVLYGRGRQIGGVMEGADITAANLYGIAGTIGLNCECGLDRNWMQGSMVPLKWEDDRQKLVAGLLGFDAEDPKIKMEMSQILSKGESSRGPAEGGATPALLDVDALLTGYEEVDTSAPTSTAGGAEVMPGAGVLADADPPLDEGSAVGGAGAVSPVAVAFMVALAGLVLLGGAFIALRGRSNNG